MPIYAATATHLTAAASSTAAGPGLLIFAAFVVAGIYALGCAVWPFRNCHHCDGIGRFRSPTGRAWRPCRHCRGTGAKLRFGRRAWIYLARVRRDGTRH